MSAHNLMSFIKRTSPNVYAADIFNCSRQSLAYIVVLTLAELWLFVGLRLPTRAGFFASPGVATGSPANRNSGTVPLVLMHVIGLQ